MDKWWSDEDARLNNHRGWWECMLLGGRGGIVCVARDYTADLAIARARQIALEHNAHAALVAACKATEAWVVKERLEGPLADTFDEIVQPKIDAALALVTLKPETAHCEHINNIKRADNAPAGSAKNLKRYHDLMGGK